MPRRLNRYGPNVFAAAGVPPGWSPPLDPPWLPRGPSRLLRWSLYGFVFSLPFDMPGRLPLELTTITGTLFLLATLLDFRLCYARPPGAIWFFLGYLFVYWLAYARGGAAHQADAVRSTLFFVQGLLILWSCVNLMRYEGVSRQVLIVLLVAATILAFMTVLGIGKRLDSDSQRATVFGQNANRAARVLGSGALIAVGLVYGRTTSALRRRWIVWPTAGLVALAVVMGGSRGGLLALATGALTFAIAGRSFGVKLRNALVAVVTIVVCLWGALQSPLMRTRIAAAQAGNLAGRERIFPAAWRMFLDRPLIGWGPSNQTVLATRLGLPPSRWPSRDTHNLALEVLTGTGVTGFFMYFMGVWLCFRAAWKGRAGREGILPLALMAALLVGNMSGNYIVLKLQWLLFAYARSAANPALPWSSRILRAVAPRTARFAGRSRR